ncbi:putative Late embryogenesis abundant protein, LEA-14 [Rosa chinensis]|uniref:Putative Late embryogenesis abundant protein, LEA-14 n=1 Tax=Rosa chinensis TaxID=74649 RepID=A0A2P6P6K0_ROSCH|nr:putative Late embryogenesis abundant protein, LEA-14 [Rosa chinensis]
MAEKIKQALASVKGVATRKDEKLPTFQSEEELKRQKRIKLFTYIGIFIVFQIIVMTVFGLTVMKVKTPKVRLGAISVQELTSVPATPLFNTSFTTQIRVKNTNWGPYKFDASIATFMYQGLPVGQVAIPKSKAGMRSTKKIDVTMSLSTNGLPSSSNLSTELNSGVLTLTSQAKLTGKVELMLIMKKKKSANMDCTIAFDLSTKTVKSLQCK